MDVIDLLDIQLTLLLQSVYAEYLQFVCDVVTTCGFDYDRDSMRIPSTKKVRNKAPLFLR